MSVDVFGRASVTRKEIILKGPPGIGFSLTDSGNFDIQRKRLCNIGEPVDLEGAVNLNFLLEQKKILQIEQKRLEEKILTEIQKLTDDINNYNIEQKKFQNDVNERFEKLIEDVNVQLNKGIKQLWERFEKTSRELADIWDKKFDELDRKNWI